MLARFDGTVARIARDLVARCRELTTQINGLERELTAACSPFPVSVPSARP
jgi:hypothetical protein